MRDPESKVRQLMTLSAVACHQHHGDAKGWDQHFELSVVGMELQRIKPRENKEF